MSTRGYKIDHRDGKDANPARKAPSDRVALLLAGGDGMRLQELTSEIVGTPIPKQYCRLLHGTSLLEATIARAQVLFPRECINVVINEDHLYLAKDQVNTLPSANIFVQPCNRDTGPGMVFALQCLERAFGDATVAVFPTDHYINRNWAFMAHVMRATNTISRLPDKIGVLGIAPDRPETGYGYILPSQPLQTPADAYHVRAFTEKPNPAAAREIIAQGGLWNTFVMIFRLSRMLELMYQMAPQELDTLSELRNSPDKATELYQTIEPWNFSTRVLARIPQHLLVFKVANVSWSDWGTPESVERTYRALRLVPSWKMAKAHGKNVPPKERVEDLLETR